MDVWFNLSNWFFLTYLEILLNLSLFSHIYVLDKHKNDKKEDNKMITISKTFETIRKDVNSENSICIAAFEKITSLLFKGVVVLGVPLIIYMILFI